MLIKTKSLFLKFPFNEGAVLNVTERKEQGGRKYTGVLVNESLHRDYFVLEISFINDKTVPKEKIIFYYDFIDIVEEI